MSRNEDINNAIWSDSDFLALSPEAKLTYVWSWTNPRCGMAGIYKVAPILAQVETGLDAGALKAAFTELAATDFAYYDEGVIWVRTRVKYLRTRTPQIARSIAKDVEKLSLEHPLRIQFMEAYGEYPWLYEQLAVLAPEGGWSLPVTVSPKRRREVFERDDNQCVLCGATERLTIDHRKPRSHGGDNSLENLQTLCLGCNARKGPTDDLALQAKSGEGLVDPLVDPLREPLVEPLERFQGKGKGTGKGQGQGLVGGKGGPGGKPDPDSPPENFPPHLEDELTDLRTTLGRIHAQRGGVAPTVRSVGMVLAAYPLRRHAQHVSDLEHWLTAGRGQGKPVRDVVAYYRNWIKDEPDATESTVSSVLPRNGRDTGPTAAEYAAIARGEA